MEKTPKKAKKKVKNGIHLKRNSKGEFYFNTTKNGRELERSSETYKNLNHLQAAMKSAYLYYKDFYENNNLKIFHDETGNLK